MVTGRVKLQSGRIENLTPPGDRAPPKMKNKFLGEKLKFVAQPNVVSANSDNQASFEVVSDFYHKF